MTKETKNTTQKEHGQQNRRAFLQNSTLASTGLFLAGTSPALASTT